jgi:bacteriocin-like protein
MNKNTKKRATLRNIHLIETLDHVRTLTIKELAAVAGGLMISNPSDPCEREADSVASGVH